MLLPQVKCHTEILRRVWVPGSRSLPLREYHTQDCARSLSVNQSSPSEKLSDNLWGIVDVYLLGFIVI
jgi:hypothetical protein